MDNRLPLSESPRTDDDRTPSLRAISMRPSPAAHPMSCGPAFPPVPKGRVICLPRQGAAALAASAERHYLDALEFDPARLIGIATDRHGHGAPTGASR